MLYKTEKKKYFDVLKQEMKKHYNKLSVTDRKNMFIVLTSHCKAMVLKGDQKFYREHFEINKDFIKTKACYEGNNFIAHYIYTSIALNALEIKEYDWAVKFINGYKPEVHIDFRESVYNYCYSYYYIYKGDYEKALEALSKVQTFDIQYKLYVNMTLLIIYYCKNETESFFSLVDSFRHFLKRNKVLKKADFVLFGNFIKYVNKIYHIKLKNPETSGPELYNLKKEIEANHKIIRTKWLLDEVDELIIKCK
jgi:hypothetical protein